MSRVKYINILKIFISSLEFQKIFRNLNTNVPITWKMANKILHPSVIKDESQGRIYINMQMYIIFKSLKFEDTNIYR